MLAIRPFLKPTMARSKQRHISGSFARLAAIVQDGVGDEWIAARDPCHPRVRLSYSRGVFCEDAQPAGQPSMAAGMTR